MSVFSIWPAVALIGAAIVILCSDRLFGFLDEAPTAHQHRLSSIDGLRGILASLVFFHHSVSVASILRTGNPVPDSKFFHAAGPASVLIFFMITAYLFWAKCLSAKIGGWAAFYINRLFRIGPLYLLLIAFYLGSVASQVDFPKGPAVSDVISQIGQWLAFGAVERPAPLLGKIELTRAVGPTWSLHFEWMFYLALPGLFVVAQAKHATAIVTAALFFVLLQDNLFTPPYNIFVVCFLIGMCTCSVLRRFPALRGDGWARSLLATATVASAVAMWSFGFDALSTVLFGLFFAQVAAGCSLFGALTTSGAKRLGNISYSVYLTHELINTLLTSLPRFRAHLTGTPGRFWLATAGAYFCVLAVSMVTYHLVERNGISVGRMISLRLERRRHREPLVA